MMEELATEKLVWGDEYWVGQQVAWWLQDVRTIRVTVERGADPQRPWIIRREVEL